uniref:V-set domain containing T cell activation inhibitor 1 n=1 Tax=Gasterosteus aculeatus aculeatus TaxID=481459 RepID=A0AAQ4P3F7_GASAC|nr:V-set domain-containing T-cell activation inhibitor 1 [Gasterosteus aculeatus aculeatus]
MRADMATIGQVIFCSMITLIVLFGAVIILILALSLSGQLSEVTSNNMAPVANLGDDALLSCYVDTKSPEAKFRDVSVTWEKAGLTVYRYRDGAPSLADQDPRFTGRAQLFPSALAAGNASLLLRGVRRSDGGEYTCSISSSGGGGTLTVNLKTAAFSAPTFKISGGVLVAEAPRWFPKPNVTWRDDDGGVLSGDTTVEENVGMFRVVSELRPVNVSDTYSCRIENELVISVSEATVAGPDRVTERTYFTFSAASSLQAATHLSITTSVLCIHHLT